MEGYKRKLWALFAIPLLLEPVCYTLYAIPYTAASFHYTLLLYPRLLWQFAIPLLLDSACFTLYAMPHTAASIHYTLLLYPIQYNLLKGKERGIKGSYGVLIQKWGL